ncbi:MAG: hypothetical protein FWF34_01275, partial [Alphaproteobacteria bacterium]|nr:hypothetical protein [Alphaproteobacteria bacterium]MCL2889873.1 hypothetical protein [Alphaproteobacteria bacterium]
MRKYFAAVCGLFVFQAHAEVSPEYFFGAEYFDGIPVEEVVVEELPAETRQPVTTVTASPRATITRTANRAAVPQAAATAQQAAPSRAVAARIQPVVRPGQAPAATARGTTPGNVSVARSATNLVQTDTVGSPLYIPTAARVTTRNPVVATTTTATNRAPTVRAASASQTSYAEPAFAGPTMEEIAQLTDFCRAQYFACMDGFCAVLDDNQGRCSCSSNIENYARIENSLKQATESLQSIAMDIQYIGLSRDEVISLFTATEAELAMSSTQDTTDMKRELERTMNLVLEIRPTTATATAGGMAFDWDSLMGDIFSDSMFDFGALFGTGNQQINNQRGAELYKTASNRCKSAVLENCRQQGIDINILTNSYDLEIDRQCIAYERALNDQNTAMRRMINNATNVLRRARLMVAQSRNEYDMRGCVNALDTCMQNEFVCGSDYSGCLDPSGRYIVNGQVVIGSTPGVFNNTAVPTTGLFTAWNVASGGPNPWVGNDMTLTQFVASTNAPFVKFMKDKIGSHDAATGRNTGFCMSVLNRCQDLTFTGTNKRFNPENQVTREFLQRIFITIKAKQDEVLANYSTSCVRDLHSCLTTNNNMNYWGGGATNTLSTAAKNACRGIAVTCQSVHGDSRTPDILMDEIWNNNS